jgi:hypothetical protein
LVLAFCKQKQTNGSSVEQLKVNAMMKISRLAVYLLLIVAVIMLLFGGGGMLLPTVANLNTDLVFVMLPVVVVTLILAVYSLIVRLVRMMVEDCNRGNQ